ncbi:MAG: MFS transporter [Tissierellia bacterium]|nr:MFS transporter [Tissierellia bacterium]
MKKQLLNRYFLWSNMVFYAPIALLIRTERGITLSEFFYLQAVLSITIFFAEIPLGMITDRIGYKKSMVMSQGLLIIARIVLYFAQTFSVFFFEAVLEGVSFAFHSGTLTAYVYEVFGKEEYAEKMASLSNYGTVGFFISTIGFYFLSRNFHQDALIVFTILTGIIAFIFILPLDEVKRKKRTQIKVSFQWEYLKIMFLNSVLSISYLLVNFFYVGLLQELGISESYMTAFILVYSAIGCLGPILVRKRRFFSTRKNLSFYYGWAMLFFLLLGKLKNYTLFIFMVILPPTLQMIGIYLGEFEQRAIDRWDKDQRATLLSLFSMGANGMDTVFLLLSSQIVRQSFRPIFHAVALIYGILAFTMGRKNRA